MEAESFVMHDVVLDQGGPRRPTCMTCTCMPNDSVNECSFKTPFFQANEEKMAALEGLNAKA